MVKWMSSHVDWGYTDMRNDHVSFDKDNQVFLFITEKTYTDGQWLYNVCSIDHRYDRCGITTSMDGRQYLVSWHKKLKIKQYKSKTTTENVWDYVMVRGKMISISALTLR